VKSLILLYFFGLPGSKSLSGINAQLNLVVRSIYSLKYINRVLARLYCLYQNFIKELFSLLFLTPVLNPGFPFFGSAKVRTFFYLTRSFLEKNSEKLLATKYQQIKNKFFMASVLL
jgi:hypothetical protein